MTELWRSLKIGDSVRVVAWPEELHKENLHNDTYEMYQWLIDTQAILTITEIDAWGLPYGHVSRVVGGIEQSEHVALNHGGLSVVAPL